MAESVWRNFPDKPERISAANPVELEICIGKMMILIAMAMEFGGLPDGARSRLDQATAAAAELGFTVKREA